MAQDTDCIIITSDSESLLSSPNSTDYDSEVDDGLLISKLYCHIKQQY